MSTARNDITGDSIQSKPSTDLYCDNWDKIFGNKSEQKEQPDDTSSSTSD